MTSQSVAEVSAPKSAISNQGTGPTTSPEQSINRDPVEQGNISTEKSLNKPLNLEQKDKLIQAAIQRRAHYNLNEWGKMDLYSLLASDESVYVGIEGGKEFFTQLLLFVARPDIAPAFHKAVYAGLDRIDRFLRFLDRVDHNYFFDEWRDLMRTQLGLEPDERDRMAKQYLAGFKLKQVLAPDAPDTPAATDSNTKA